MALVRWIDTSSAQISPPGLTDSNLTDLRNLGYRHVCYRVYDGDSLDNNNNTDFSLCRNSLQRALDAGMGISTYIYLTRTPGAGGTTVTHGARSVEAAVEYFGDMWGKLSWVGVDLEPIASFGSLEAAGWTDAVLSDVRECVQAIQAARQRPVIYTFASFWVTQFANSQEFNHLPFWLAWWNHNKGQPSGPVPTTVEGWPAPYTTSGVGGWEQPVARQYEVNPKAGLNVHSNISDERFWRVPQVAPSFPTYGGWTRRSGHEYESVRLGLNKHIVTSGRTSVRLDTELSVFSSDDLGDTEPAEYAHGPATRGDPKPNNVELSVAEEYTAPHQRQYIMTGATGGTFTLELGSSGQKTAPIPYNATAGQIESALEALDSIVSVEVTGIGSHAVPWYVIFVDSAIVDYPKLTPDGSLLTGDRNVYVYSDRYDRRPVDTPEDVRRAGEAGYRMFTRGIDIAPYIITDTVVIQDESNPLGDTMNFEMLEIPEDEIEVDEALTGPDEPSGSSEDSIRFSVKPTLGTVITLWYEGEKEFEGVITQVTERRDTPTTLKWEVIATGYWTWLDSRVIRNTILPRQSATDMIHYIITTFAKDFSTLRVTGVNQQSREPEPDPGDGSQSERKLPFVPKKEWDYIRPSQAMNQLRIEGDFFWFIDFDRNIVTYREGESTGVAPLEVLYIDNIERRDGRPAGSEISHANYYIDTRYWDFVRTEDIQQLRTVIYMRGYDVAAPDLSPVIVSRETVDRIFSLRGRTFDLTDRNFHRRDTRANNR